jgi:hypothetical protein
LGSKFKSSKYQPYISGLNLLPALNPGEMRHFWMDTKYPNLCACGVYPRPLNGFFNPLGLCG